MRGFVSIISFMDPCCLQYDVDFLPLWYDEDNGIFWQLRYMPLAVFVGGRMWCRTGY
jgi:hypothetical protein